jgi:hypothetical protein
VDGENFPAILLNPLNTHEQCRALCCHILHILHLLPWTFFMQWMTKLLEHLKVMNSTDGFPLLQKLDQYASFSTLK